jgi:hypothetical protein
MRKYKIIYWAERRDECVDLERVIEAPTIQDALNLFLNLDLIYKRIDSIKELAG